MAPHDLLTGKVKGENMKSKLTKDPKNGTTIFEVTYLGTLGTGWRGEVSRTIELKDTQTLADLRDAIQESVGWDDPHLYSFFMDGKVWGSNLDQEYVHPQLHRYLQGKRAMCPVDLMWYPTENFLWHMERRPRSADTPIKTLGLSKGRRFLYRNHGEKAPGFSRGAKSPFWRISFGTLLPGRLIKPAC